MYLQNNYSVLSTIQAAGADVSYADNILSITGSPSIDMRVVQSIPTGIQQTVAEVLQVTTVTPVAVASTEYKLWFYQWNPVLNIQVQKMISYTTAASGDTATTICNAWRSILAADDGGLNIVFTGAGTLICTAAAGYPVFTISEGSANITQATGTIGVYAVGTYAVLTLQGYTGLTAGKTYTTISFDYNKQDGNVNASNESSDNLYTILIQDDAANYSALIVAIAEALTYAGFLGNNSFPQDLTGAGAVNITSVVTFLRTTAADALTLADGAVGQYKFIKMLSDGGDGTLTPTNLNGGTTLTFGDANDRCLLKFYGTEWYVMGNVGVVLA